MKSDDLETIIKKELFKPSYYWNNGICIKYDINNYFYEFYDIIDNIRYYFEDMFKHKI